MNKNPTQNEKQVNDNISFCLNRKPTEEEKYRQRQKDILNNIFHSIYWEKTIFHLK